MEWAIPPVSPKTGEVLPGFPDGYYYETEEGKYLLVAGLFPKELTDGARELELYPDDIIGVGYPKSGKNHLCHVKIEHSVHNLNVNCLFA